MMLKSRVVHTVYGSRSSLCWNGVTVQQEEQGACVLSYNTESVPGQAGRVLGIPGGIPACGRRLELGELFKVLSIPTHSVMILW